MAIDFRNKLLALMQATLADETTRHDWTYRAIRPMYVPASWHPGQWVTGDCSKGVQYLCRWAGVPNDPMGEVYGPYGNSNTLWSHLQHADHPSQLKVGDFITFGADGSEHATMVMVAGNDPLLWSFGHQGAPNTYHLSEDGRESQYLINPLPVYVPTPDDKLRAKTGYFAWMQWKLGEGDWKNKVKEDPKVRPNVPTVIPADWWVKRAKFLLNRKRGDAATK